MGQRHQSEKRIAAVVAEADVGRNTAEGHQQRNQAAAQQLLAQARPDRVDRLTTGEERPCNGFNRLNHRLALGSRQRWQAQQQRLTAIQKLHPGSAQVGERLALLLRQLQAADHIRDLNRLELGAGVITATLQLNLRATGEIQAGTEGSTNRRIQPAEHQAQQADQNHQTRNEPHLAAHAAEGPAQSEDRGRLCR